MLRLILKRLYKIILECEQEIVENEIEFVSEKYIKGLNIDTEQVHATKEAIAGIILTARIIGYTNTQCLIEDLQITHGKIKSFKYYPSKCYGSDSHYLALEETMEINAKELATILICKHKYLLNLSSIYRDLNESESYKIRAANQEVLNLFVTVTKPTLKP